MTKEQIYELARASEQRARFKDTFIDVLHTYDAEAKDIEFLAFVGCLLMTGNAEADKKTVEDFLCTVRKHTSSVWDYIDRELYMLDYAIDLRMLPLLMLLHEIILTTQTIENSVKLSLQYNDSPSTFFFRLFTNAGMDEYLSDFPQYKVFLFLSLMVRDEPVGLRLWRDWISPSHLQVPMNARLFEAAHEMGILSFYNETDQNRSLVTSYFRGFFPEDPVRGYFALLSYADRKAL